MTDFADLRAMAALVATSIAGPSEEQVAAAPGALVRLLLAGPRQVGALYAWGERRLYRPRMVRALIADLVEREQLAASDPVGLSDWSWVWHPETASGPGTPPPLDLSGLPDPDEREEAPPEAPSDDSDDEAPVPQASDDDDDGLTRDQQRSRRAREVRAVSIDTRRLPLLERRRIREEAADHPGGRPRTRGECADGPRPCVWASCRYNLYLDITDIGGIKLNFPDLQVEEMAESCALDVADRGGVVLDQVAAAMNLTRERVRQIEIQALQKISRQAKRPGVGLNEFVDVSGTGVAVEKARIAHDAIPGPVLRLVALMAEREWTHAELLAEMAEQGWRVKAQSLRNWLSDAHLLGLIESKRRGRCCVYQTPKKAEAAE